MATDRTRSRSRALFEEECKTGRMPEEQREQDVRGRDKGLSVGRLLHGGRTFCTPLEARRATPVKRCRPNRALSIGRTNAVAEKPSYGRVPHCSEGERIPDFLSIVWVKIVFASKRGRMDAARTGQDGQGGQDVRLTALAGEMPVTRLRARCPCVDEMSGRMDAALKWFPWDMMSRTGKDARDTTGMRRWNCL